VRCAAPAPQPLQRVEDQVEPHLELGRGDVARDDQLCGGRVEVGEAVGRDLGHEDLLGHVGELLLRVEGQRRHLQREPVDVAVEEPVGVGGRDDREAGAPEEVLACARTARRPSRS